MKNRECSPQELKNKAEQWCAKCEQAEYDIRTKLYRLGAETGVIDMIVDHLYEDNYLDSTRFCRAFVHDKLLYQHWGREKLKAALLAKRLPAKDIQSAISEIDEKQYQEILKHVAEQKKRSLKNDDKSYEKLCRFLLQRGFTYSDIANSELSLNYPPINEA